MALTKGVYVCPKNKETLNASETILTKKNPKRKCVE